MPNQGARSWVFGLALLAAFADGCATLEMPAPNTIIVPRAPRKKPPPPVEAPPTPEPEVAPTPQAPVSLVEEGMASYYADKLRGRRTASGVRYDPTRETCAHRTHKFGTSLRITVLATGKTATCQVIDRGPWVDGRVVDVSKKMATKLGILGKGVVRVRVAPADLKEVVLR